MLFFNFRNIHVEFNFEIMFQNPPQPLESVGLFPRRNGATVLRNGAFHATVKVQR